MKVEITYSTPCEATVYETNGDSWSYNFRFSTVQEALEWAEFQIDVRPINFEIAKIYITDAETGELIAECTSESGPTAVEDWDDEPNYDEYDSGEDYDDADLEMGFNPYLGCYDYDC